MLSVAAAAGGLRGEERRTGVEAVAVASSAPLRLRLPWEVLVLICVLSGLDGCIDPPPMEEPFVPSRVNASSASGSASCSSLRSD